MTYVIVAILALAAAIAGGYMHSKWIQSSFIRQLRPKSDDATHLAVALSRAHDIVKNLDASSKKSMKDANSKGVTTDHYNELRYNLIFAVKRGQELLGGNETDSPSGIPTRDQRDAAEQARKQESRGSSKKTSGRYSRGARKLSKQAAAAPAYESDAGPNEAIFGQAPAPIRARTVGGNWNRNAPVSHDDDTGYVPVQRN